MKALAAILLLCQSAMAGNSSTLSLPDELKDYPSWTRLSPPDYSVPSSLASSCIAPLFDPLVKDHVPNPPTSSTTLVDVYANPIAEKSAFLATAFPEGSIIVKNKHAAVLQLNGTAESQDKSRIQFVKKKTLGEGVMIKGSKGSSPATGDWQFAYYPSMAGASFSRCVECHKSAPHDFVFARYMSKSR